MWLRAMLVLAALWNRSAQAGDGLGPASKDVPDAARPPVTSSAEGP